MADTSSKHVQVTFAIEGVDEKLCVLSFSGEEALSNLFEYYLVLATESAELDLAKVVGSAAVLLIDRDGQQRYVHGTVSTFRQLGQSGRFTTYEAYLVPRVWRLLHFQDSRTFQGKTAEQIVSTVLEDAGVDSSLYEISLDQNNPTPTVEYSVQYRESHWAYISRLLEDTGFYYFFEHGEDGHKLLIANFYQFHPPIAGEPKVLFHAPSTTMPASEHIFQFSYRESVRPDKVTLGDFNPLKPSLDLKTDVKSKRGGAKDKTMEVYDYPAEYSVPEKGAKKAKMRLEGLQASARIGEGQSDCARMAAGHYFTLTDHFREDISDRSYLLTLVRHTFEKHGDLEAGAADTHGRYTNTFQCIPREVPFRPQHSTPKPSTNGVQTAVVVGPWGEEIHTDKLGRVKVQFHWDRHGEYNEKSSCWVPVAQSWAGQGWGAAFIPRIGDEVIVDFVEGDPDRPIVTGRIYHAQNVPPLVLPDQKTRSTIMSNSSPGGGGFNELRFEDKKGAEEIHVHAQKDLDIMVRDNMTVGVRASQTTGVGGGQSVSVGGDRTLKVKKKITTVVGEDATEDFKASRAVTLVGDLSQAVGGDRSESITGDRATAVQGKDLLEAMGKIGITSPSGLTLASGASTVTISPAGVELNGPLVKINCVGMPESLQAMMTRLESGLGLMVKELKQRVRNLKARKVKAGSAYRKARMDKQQAATAVQIERVEKMQAAVKQAADGADPDAAAVTVARPEVEFDPAKVDKTAADIKQGVQGSKQELSDKSQELDQQQLELSESVHGLGNSSYEDFKQAKVLAAASDGANAGAIAELDQAVKGLGQGLTDWSGSYKDIGGDLAAEAELDPESLDKTALDGVTLDELEAAQGKASNTEMLGEIEGMGEEMKSAKLTPGGLASSSPQELSGALASLEEKQDALDDAEDKMADLQQQKDECDKAQQLLDELDTAF